VRDDQQGLASLAGGAEEPEHVASRGRVEIAGGFVAEHDVRGVRESPRQRDPLLLSARELGRCRGASVADAELAHELRRGSPSILTAPADEEQGQLDVLDGRERRQQVEELKDEADPPPTQASQLGLAQLVDAFAVEVHLSGGGAIEAREQVEQGRLPTAARPHDRDELATLDREVDAAQRQHLRAATGVVGLRGPRASSTGVMWAPPAC
jgi:hypothetical protein